METFTKEKLKEILYLHTLWLNDDEKGSNANLSNADLSYADLRNADLRYADLRNANLSNANLSNADLSYADLRYADLRNANLSNANLRNADLRYANLSYADLSYADFRGTAITSARLYFAEMEGVQTNEETAFYHQQCPEFGEYTAFKKAGGRIVVLKIPEDAKRSSATSRKCRASKAEVLRIESIDGKENFQTVRSNYDRNFIYEVGKTVEVMNFDENRWNECSTGIHHFMTRQEAVDY